MTSVISVYREKLTPPERRRVKCILGTRGNKSVLLSSWDIKGRANVLIPTVRLTESRDKMNGKIFLAIALICICTLAKVVQGFPVIDPDDIENSHKPAPEPFRASVSRKVSVINTEDIENSHKPAPEPFHASREVHVINTEDFENSHKHEPFLASASRGGSVINPEDIENTHKPAPEPFLKSA